MSMIALLRGPLEAAPDAAMLVDAGVGEPITLSRAGFWRRVVALRDELVARGVEPGGCIATWLPNWSDALIWQFAAVAAGAHVIGINTRYNIEEARHVLELARPSVVAIAHGFLSLDLRARLVEAARGSRSVPSVAVIAGPRGAAPSVAECAGYDLGAGTWVPSGAESEGMLADAPDRLAAAFTTSGSTGRPKLAGHRVAAVATHAVACAEAGGWTGRSVHISALPLSGVFAYAPAMATIAAGGVLVLEPAFDVAAIVADIARHRVTHLIGGDDIVGRLFETPDALASLERLFIADFNGRSVPLAAEAERRVGLVAAGVYGSSELFALTSFWRPEDPAPGRWMGGGRPVSPAIVVRAGDPETGVGLAAGAAGELQFRGYNVVDGYLGDPARRDTVLTADGWFRSGDLGTVRPDGSFEYLCRAGDALRLRGFLVEPAEIESRLIEHPAVAEAKVVGLRPAEGETQAIGFAVLKAETTPAELLAWCAATLARHKVPHALHVIEAMPVTAGVNGTKVRASTLREWAAALAADPSLAATSLRGV